MGLFEDLDLPAVLYMPRTRDGWVRTVHARWADLQASLAVRDESVASLIEETHRFAEAIKVLAPLMEAYPDLTVAEALLVLEGERR